MLKGECKMENVDYNNVENSIKNLENKDLVLAYKEQHGGKSILKNVTDGYHTFDELYYHRMVLSKLVFEVYKQYAWKSWLHSDGTMFEGSFIVGVSIPGIGDYSYHYDAQYFDFFDVPEVDRAPEYDGHTPDNVKRLLGLKNAE